jgi:hypothetical protein
MSATNDCGHRGRGDEQRETQSSRDCRSSTWRGRPWYFNIGRPEHLASIPGLLKRTRKRKLAYASLAPFKFPHFYMSLFL